MRAGALFGAVAVVIGFGATAADAAMCGRSCNSGGRYYPGPPEVCAQYDLNYCGPSRGGPPPVVTSPGITIGPGGVGVYGPGVQQAPGSNCRTITVERDDGSVRRIRRCD
jgi:hypothetical protein